MSLGIAILAAALRAPDSGVNLVGAWVLDTGVGWTITTRIGNRCLRRNELTIEFRLRPHRLPSDGDKYVFTVTYGASYRSENNGVITE